MTKPKKLIEVAMPVKEISAESVRDKSIRHGHISTLHLWWARRPLPVCRAVVFASLVPDPLDDNCPTQFKESVELLLGKGNDLTGDPYKPYDDIPHTAVVDKMEDNLRNRLMMFIGKFSDKYVLDEKLGNKTASKDLLHQFSLIKWDNKNDDKIIGRARKLIFVSHNAETGLSAKELLLEYERLNGNIKKAEAELYNYPNRHIETEEVKRLEKAKDNAIAAFLDKMPKVFDPFAGGGAIPLEAARLGCNSYGNDLNPVAHIIQKGSCEFPQKFGKPITYSKDEFVKIYGKEELQKQQFEGNIFGDTVNIQNRLAHDVEYYAKKLLSNVESEIGHFYPKDKDGNKPIAYYWVRVGYCSNPSCQAEVPLLKGFYLCNKPNKKIYLDPIIENKSISFEIKKGTCDIKPWVIRNSLVCPCCGNSTDEKQLKNQFISKRIKERLICLINSNREYKLLDKSEVSNYIWDKALIPSEKLPTDTRITNTILFGYTEWGDIFNERQKMFLTTLINSSKELFSNSFTEYEKAIKTYIAILIDRICAVNTSFGVWHNSRETLERPMSRQALFMVFDYPESYPFTNSTGGSKNQIAWITKYINSESNNSFKTECNNASSGEKNQFPNKFLNVVVTDPPYYDAIAYADISDFFYVWLKRTLNDVFPINFATPQTPKKEECTAIKLHHNNDLNKAKKHFETKLLEIFDAIEFQTNDLISIMFAHQSTEAWTTLCNSVLNARLNLVGSWANDTEMTGALKSGKAFLASSVTVACKPSIKLKIGDYKEVEKEIIKVIKIDVKELYALGFRGADLLTACFGKAVSVFGRYELVEKADGSEVTVAELLEMAREAAFEAIVSDINTDDLTKFYIGWLNLFGFSEAAHDDVRRISQIGLSVDISDIYGKNILVKDGDKGILGSMLVRISKDKNLGLRPVNNNDIDIAQRMLYLFDPTNASRAELLEYVAEKAPNSESPIWRVLNSLVELLPKSKEMKDQELAAGLISNQDNLIRESKNRIETLGQQSKLEFD